MKAPITDNDKLTAIRDALHQLSNAYRAYADQAMEHRDPYLVHRAISEANSAETKIRRIQMFGRI